MINTWAKLTLSQLAAAEDCNSGSCSSWTVYHCFISGWFCIVLHVGSISAKDSMIQGIRLIFSCQAKSTHANGAPCIFFPSGIRLCPEIQDWPDLSIMRLAASWASAEYITTKKTIMRVSRYITSRISAIYRVVWPDCTSMSICVDTVDVDYLLVNFLNLMMDMLNMLMVLLTSSLHHAY